VCVHQQLRSRSRFDLFVAQHQQERMREQPTRVDVILQTFVVLTTTYSRPWTLSNCTASP